MAEIPLRSRAGAVRAIALVDDEDAARLSGYRWCLTSHGYAQRGTNANGVFYLHREVLNLDRGDGVVVDHVNRNKLDNRKRNLRVVPQLINANNLAAKGGSSKFRSVYLRKDTGRWAAMPRWDGRRHHLGCFDSEREAAELVAAFYQARVPGYDYWAAAA
jgi:hypothetical protein